jgi:hypothetical protein
MNDHTYTLTYGPHETREDGLCLMEAVAYLAGEPHTDAPACACPVLTKYAVRLNDAMGIGPDGDALRARYLHDLAPMLVGSRSTPDVEEARAYVLADHAVRVFAPLALESAGLHGQAKRLRTLGAVIDRRSAYAAAQASAAASRAAAEASRAAQASRTAAGVAAGIAAGVAYDAAEAAAVECTRVTRAAAAAAGAADWCAARAAIVAALEAAP